MFIVGERSGFLSEVAKDIVGEIAEKGSFVGIPDSGHYPAEENPAAFAQAVLAFCQASGSPGH